ncbi:MAG: hypothetical protein ACJ76A_00740 [Actinomycetota bacterium]
MGHRLPRAAIVLVVAGASFIAATLPAAAIPAMPQTKPATIVTLLTGERVVLGGGAGGAPTVQIVRAATDGPGAVDKVVRLGGDTYVIPASAMAYFGKHLDASLFDVTALAAAGFGRRIPLVIAYEVGTKPALPGVTITSARNGVAHGYVTPTSAKDFGAALSAKAIADSGAGWPSSRTLFGSVTAIAPDMVVPTTVTPRFPMSTLIMDGISRTGGAMPFGFGYLVNMDDGRKFNGIVVMYHGQARASVPVGTYGVVLDDLVFSTDGSVTIREDVVTDFAVTGSQGHMTIDSRDATAVPSITTPMPSVPLSLDTEIDLNDQAHHFFSSWGWTIGLPGASIRFTPQPDPQVGSLRWSAHWITVDPSTPGGAYDFDATFAAPGIPADESRSLGPVSQAMTVDNTYDSDASFQIAGAARFVFLPKSFGASATFWPIPIPLHRVDYVYAPSGSTVEDLALANYNAPWDPGFVDGPFELFSAGSSSAQTWFRDPYALDVPLPPADARRFACLACASDTRLVYVNNLHDSDPQHSVEIFGGPGRTPIAHFRVYRDGQLLIDKPDRLGGEFKIPSGPATYRIVNDLSRRFTFSPFSTMVTTDVTFHSWQSVPAPANYFCYTRDPCSIMPVVSARLGLDTTTRGTLPVGRHVFDLGVGHVQGARPFPITSVVVSVRRAGTTTWKPLAVTSSGTNQYQAHLKALAWMQNRLFDIQVSVTDSKGNALVQTTDDAFVVSP